MKQRAVIEIENYQVKTKINLPDGKYFADIITTDTRSNKQNRYYRGIVIPMIQQGLKDLGTEVSMQEVHEYLKAKFNYTEFINKESGEYERIPVSTTRLNKGGFNDYLHSIQIFAADSLHIEIPDPGTQTELKYSALKK